MLQISIGHKSLENAQKWSGGLPMKTFLRGTFFSMSTIAKCLLFVATFCHCFELEIFASKSSHFLVCLVAKLDSIMPNIRFPAKF